MRVRLDRGELLEELFQADRGIDHDRAHVGQVLQMRIEIDGIEDAEGLLADLVATPGRPAQHLFVEDAAVDAAQKHEVRDLGDIDPGGQQIDGDGDLRQVVVAIGADQPADLIDAAGDLADGGVLDLAVARLERLLQLIDDDVGMGVGGGKEQGLARQVRIDVLCQLLGHDPVEVDRHDLLIEGIDLEVDLVRNMGQVDLAGSGIEQLDLLALAEMNPGLREGGGDLDRRLMVDQVAVDDRLAVGVGVNRIAEDLHRMQRGRCGQADLDRVEVLQDPAVLGDVVRLAAEAELAVGELAVQEIAPVALVDDDQIVLVDGRDISRIGVVKHPAHQPLNGADMDLGFRLGTDGVQSFEIEDIGEGLGPDHLGGRELPAGLLPQGAAVHHEADAAKALRVEKSKEQGDGELGLAGAGRHGDQQGPRAFGNAPLDRLDGLLLIGPQGEAEHHRLHLEGLPGGLDVDLQPGLEPFRRRPVAQCAAMMGGLAGIAKPDAALGLDLLEIGPSIGREDKGDPVGVPRPSARLRLAVFQDDVARIALGLIDGGGDVLAFALRLHRAETG